MKGWTARLGLAGLLVAGLALATVGVHAGGKDGDDDGERTVEKRVEVIRLGGGSFLGVHLEEADSGRGAKIKSVEPESAAEKAGIQDGDVITAFDGETVRSARQLARLVRETPAGREIAIELQRGGAKKTVTATLDEGNRFHHRLHLGGEHAVIPEIEDFHIEIDPSVDLPHGPNVFRWHGGDHDFTMGWHGRPRLGVQYMEIGEQLAEYFQLDAEEAVLVTGVNEDSPAAQAGIKAGDIVLEFGGEAVRDGGDLRGAVRRAKGGETVAMKVHRDGRSVDVQVALPEPEKPKKVRRQTGVSL